LGKLAQLVGVSARLAKPREVFETTGYRVGGVPPIALPSSISVIVDQSLIERGIVYGGGGEDGVLLEFNVKEFVELVKPIVADVSR